MTFADYQAAEVRGPRVLIDLKGKRFGKLLVLGREEDRVTPSGQKKVQWLCVCDCGNTSIVASQPLRNGSVKSCGCNMGQTALKDGRFNHPLYRTWQGMMGRCYNKDSKDYPKWGGRGIQVCERWRKSPLAFYDDMGARPSPKHSLDRIDNNGDYTPENCRWATVSEQANNRKSSVRVQINGQALTLAECAMICGVTKAAISWRAKQRNCTLEESVSYYLSK